MFFFKCIGELENIFVINQKNKFLLMYSSSGEVLMPTSVSDSNIMKRLLDDAELDVLRRHQSHEVMQQEKKSDRLMKKTIQGVHQMSKDPSSHADVTMFR